MFSQPLLPEAVNAVVIEVGSYSMKAGFAGEDTPKVVCPSEVGVMPFEVNASTMDPHVGSHTMAAARRIDVGHETIGFPIDDREIVSPISDGHITEWDLVERLWQYALEERLCVQSRETPILLVEPSVSSKVVRETMTELMFEKYEVPALFVAKDAVLNTYDGTRFTFANEKKTPGTALIVDFGHAATRVVPVHEGYVKGEAIRSSPVGGSFLTSQWLKYVEEKGKSVVPLYALQKKEIEPSVFEVSVRDFPKVPSSFRTFHVNRVINDMKHMHAHLSHAAFVPQEGETIPPVAYALPDGTVLDIGAERFSISELLFNPAPLGEEFANSGVLNLILSSIEACGQELHRDLLTNVVVTGGTSLSDGLLPRIKGDLEAFNDSQQLLQVRTKVVSSQRGERSIGAWLGGSILGSVKENTKMWMSKSEFEERGVDLVERKCP